MVAVPPLEAQEEVLALKKQRKKKKCYSTNPSATYSENLPLCTSYTEVGSAGFIAHMKQCMDLDASCRSCPVEVRSRTWYVSCMKNCGRDLSNTVGTLTVHKSGRK